LELIGCSIVVFFASLGEGGEGVNEAVWKREGGIGKEGVDGLDEIFQRAAVVDKSAR
jgi:hypothetical protein